MNAASPILFDLDGTLLDTHDMILESMRYTINEVDGQNQNDGELMAGVGTPLLDQMLHFTAGNKTRAEELVNIYRAYNDAIHDENIHAFPGTREAACAAGWSRLPHGRGHLEAPLARSARS